MAQQTSVRLVDDLDGGKAAETVAFGLDGASFETVIKLENRNQVLASNTQDGINGVISMRDRTPIVFENK